MSNVSDNNRNKLLKAAAELFSDKGFDAVSTRDLCTRAEVNVAAISYYFGGKEGLYLEVFREYSQKLADRIDSALSNHQGKVNSRVEMEKALRDLIETFVQIRIHQPEISIVLQRHAIDKIPGVREAFHSTMQPVGANLTQFFQDLQSAKMIREDVNVRSFIAIMVESIWGYFSLQDRGGSLLQDAYRLPADQEKFADFLSQIFVRGITSN
ncbi:TetR/AcrR family transcriptional regulator [Bdellovibrio sp. HCB337]|uniref:TetR/AcrR family transcriptional regulator n=1 Tax=Bdellovibrio sp. HCB337 TaxID=3394358 RepID=UPI0039A5ECB7